MNGRKPDAARTWFWAADVLALWGLAVAQPLYDLLGKHPGFLVAHRVSGGWLLFLVALLSLVMPLLVVGVLWPMVRGPGRAGTVVRGLVVALLVAAFSSAPLGRSGFAPAAVSLLAACGLGLLAGWLYATRAGVRLFCHWLWPSTIVLPAVFLSTGTAAGLWRSESGPTELAHGVSADVPVVMVVLDELPLVSLLDADGQIDRGRFPDFAALAETATWYRNASGVHQSTDYALPAILSGRRPDMSLAPHAADHPWNLFTLLGGAYEVRAYEACSRLCPSWLSDAPRTGQAPAHHRALQLVADLGVIYVNIVLPELCVPTSARLTHAWRDFGAVERRFLGGGRLGDYGRRHEQFRAFIQDIRAGERPTLHFLHVLLPHVPWSYTPAGRLYLPENLMHVPGLDVARETWQQNAWLVGEARERHLMQLELVDRLLGELVRRLRTAGLFDRSLLVVTADHGVGFEPGASRRDPARTNHPEDMMLVPLFVKAPHQRSGRTSDRNVEAIDILPTMAALLGVDVPWRVDGRAVVEDAVREGVSDADGSGETTVETSAVMANDSGVGATATGVSVPETTAAARRFAKRMMNDRGEMVEIAAYEAGRLEAAAQRLSRIDPRRLIFEALEANGLGTCREWLGAELASLPRAAAIDAELRLSQDVVRWQQKGVDTYVPLLLLGTLQAGQSNGAQNPARLPFTEHTLLAIAVDGRLLRFAPLLRQGERSWAVCAMLPEAALSEGEHRIELFCIEPRAQQPTLRPIAVVPEVIRVGRAAP